MCLAQEDFSPNLYKLKPSDFDCLHIFLRNTPLGLDERWKIIRRNSLEKDLKGTVKGEQGCSARGAGAAAGAAGAGRAAAASVETSHQNLSTSLSVTRRELALCSWAFVTGNTKNTECTIDWERGSRRETLFKKG